MGLYNTTLDIIFSYFLLLFFVLSFIFQKHYTFSRSSHVICFSVPLKMVPILRFILLLSET